MKLMSNAFLGTFAAHALAGYLAMQWVEEQKQEIRAEVHQTISDVIDAPANAANDFFKSLGL